MALDVTDWNLNPNQRFFVRLTQEDVMLIDIFNTKADMDADVSRVAFGTAPLDENEGQPVVLEADTTEPSSGDPISLFNTDLDYHLKVTGDVVSGGQPDVKLQIGPFTELPPIEDALLVTEAMIQARATLELNRGTHSAFRRNIRLDKHYEALNEGDIISLSSTKRGLASEPNRIDDLSIEVQITNDGELNMFDIVDLAVFEDVVR